MQFTRFFQTGCAPRTNHPHSVSPNLIKTNHLANSLCAPGTRPPALRSLRTPSVLATGQGRHLQVLPRRPAPGPGKEGRVKPRSQGHRPLPVWKPSNTGAFRLPLGEGDNGPSKASHPPSPEGRKEHSASGAREVFLGQLNQRGCYC